jgi:putative ABC transport system permease protein
LGSNLLIVLPGRSETTGGQPPLLGETPRDLTLDDALALQRSRNIMRVAPVAVGFAPVSRQGLEREVNIIGTTAAFQKVRHIDVAQGRFLPETDPDEAVPVCVIGQRVRSELFGSGRVLGQWVRIGDRRFRVIGILAPRGESVGVDFDDIVMIPVASAQVLFDTPGLFRVLAEAISWEAMAAAAADIHRIVQVRHEGEDDVTVITQDSVIDTFDKILLALTLAVAGIAAISLAVAGVLIMNVMLVSVSQRTSEIGLLKAIGAAPDQLRLMFLTEAGLLSLLGAGVGIGLGLASVWLLQRLYPAFPITTPVWAVLAAATIAFAAGVLFGVLPAGKAARLDPVQALARH